MIRGIKFASVPVTDQDRALAFYTKKLGFSVVTDQPFGENDRWLELRIPGADTRVVLWKQPDRAGQFGGFVFWTDDVEGTHKELTAKGVTFDQPPKKEPWGTSAIFRDSEGNQFVLGTK